MSNINTPWQYSIKPDLDKSPKENLKEAVMLLKILLGQDNDWQIQVVKNKVGGMPMDHAEFIAKLKPALNKLSGLQLEEYMQSLITNNSPDAKREQEKHFNEFIERLSKEKDEDDDEDFDAGDEWKKNKQVTL